MNESTRPGVCVAKQFMAQLHERISDLEDRNKKLQIAHDDMEQWGKDNLAWASLCIAERSTVEMQYEDLRQSFIKMRDALTSARDWINNKSGAPLRSAIMNEISEALEL